MLVYGIANGSGFYQGMQVNELTEQVHQEGGIVVMAHPCRYSDDIPEEIYSAGIDGVEVMGVNVRAYMQDGIRRIQEHLRIPGFARTDAHVVEMLGVFATDFDDDIETERDLEQERHLSRKDIKAKYGFNYSFQYGVKNGKDMRLI